MKSATQRYLIAYSIVVTLVFVMVLLWAVNRLTSGKVNFKELTAEQIRIKEPDGTLRMILSNHSRFPGIIVNGIEKPFERPQAGMVFYNDEASEIGGLIFGGHKNEKGQIVNSGGALSFDRYNSNQEVQLIGVHDFENQFAGLIVSDSPPDKQGHRRLWAGKNNDGSVSIALMDSAGIKRLAFTVSATGESSIVFLDKSGKTVNEIKP